MLMIETEECICKLIVQELTQGRCVAYYTAVFLKRFKNDWGPQMSWKTLFVGRLTVSKMFLKLSILRNEDIVKWNVLRCFGMKVS